MSNQEILTKAIEKAIAGGWKKPMKIWKAYDEYIYGTDGVGKSRIWVNDIIFNHEFAKALWGENLGNQFEPPLQVRANEEIKLPLIPAYQHHLQQMVIAEDPIAYLGDNL